MNTGSESATSNLRPQAWGLNAASLRDYNLCKEPHMTPSNQLTQDKSKKESAVNNAK